MLLLYLSHRSQGTQLPPSWAVGLGHSTARFQLHGTRGPGGQKHLPGLAGGGPSWLSEIVAGAHLAVAVVYPEGHAGRHEQEQRLLL